MQRIEVLVEARRLSRSTEAKSIRERAGLSLADLAEVIGVDAATLSRWEHGTSRPRTDSALRWLAALQAILRSLPSTSDAATTQSQPEGMRP